MFLCKNLHHIFLWCYKQKLIELSTAYKNLSKLIKIKAIQHSGQIAFVYSANRWLVLSCTKYRSAYAHHRRSIL